MLTPQQALEELKAGNRRFVSGRSLFPNVSPERRKETFAGQKPFATIIACSDSRTPPSYIFDQGLGDIFVIRVAGDICGKTVLASVELGADHCVTKLIVVLGHRKCGVVSMAVKNSPVSEAVREIINKIKHAELTAKLKNPDLSEDDFIEAVSRENARNTAAELMKRSILIKEKTIRGELEITAAWYDIESGEVEWLGGHY